MGRTRARADWKRRVAPEVADIDDFMGKPPRKRTRSKAPDAASIRRAVSDIDRRVRDKDWDDLTPTVFVALFVWCHVKVYGAEPAELMAGATFSKARFAVARMIKSQFGDDRAAALAFVQWTWDGEQRTEKWRREKNGGVGRTIDWVGQFCRPEMITKYRVAMARKDGLQ